MNLNCLWYGIPQKLNVTRKKFHKKFKYDVIRRERGVLSNYGLFWIFGQSLLFSPARMRGVKFQYFYADVMCEWSPTNKNKLQFNINDSNLEGGNNGDHYGP